MMTRRKEQDNNKNTTTLVPHSTPRFIHGEKLSYGSSDFSLQLQDKIWKWPGNETTVLPLIKLLSIYIYSVTAAVFSNLQCA